MFHRGDSEWLIECGFKQPELLAAHDAVVVVDHVIEDSLRYVWFNSKMVFAYRTGIRRLTKSLVVGAHAAAKLPINATLAYSSTRGITFVHARAAG